MELTDPNRSTELAPLQERAKTMLEHQFDQTKPCQDTNRQKRHKTWHPDRMAQIQASQAVPSDPDRKAW